jgi:hypothetical protein
MKEKFESLKKLNVGTIMSQPEQKNVLGGYQGTINIYCYFNTQYLGWTYVDYYYSGSYRQKCKDSSYTTTNRTETYIEPNW